MVLFRPSCVSGRVVPTPSKTLLGLILWHGEPWNSPSAVSRGAPLLAELSFPCQACHLHCLPSSHSWAHTRLSPYTETLPTLPKPPTKLTVLAHAAKSSRQLASCCTASEHCGVLTASSLRSCFPWAAQLASYLRARPFRVAFHFPSIDWHPQGSETWLYEVALQALPFILVVLVST